MQVTLKNITIRELTENFHDNDEGGVTGYGGLLDIRPPYQREFVYNDKQQEAVIDTVMKGFPLNVMYWADKDDGTYEIIDGQQRTLSICRYVDSAFSYKQRAFHNLQQDEKDRILDYELTVYVCSGTDSEKLEWFKTINIAGEQLTDQELRNAVYAGPWLNEAKKYFSRTGCPAYQLAEKYMRGTPIRQDYLETVLKWISGGNIEQYMSDHQHDKDADELITYFTRVIDWVEELFVHQARDGKPRREMKGLPWGEFYNKYKNRTYDPVKIEEEVSRLMQDEDVTNKRGIYHYVLSGEEKHLNIRAFTPRQRREAYERQNGICPVCNNHFEFEDMEADHITPWHLGGKTESANCQMLCKADNRKKAGK